MTYRDDVCTVFIFQFLTAELVVIHIQLFLRLVFVVLFSESPAVVLQAPVLLLATRLVCVLGVFVSIELHRVNLGRFLEEKRRRSVSPPGLF